jgi:recombinational DNA repair protein (RecF pathway)
MQKISITDELDQDETSHSVNEHTGLFNILSNGIFNLNSSLKERKYNLHQQLFLYLTKLINELGVLPEYKNCLHCGIDLALVDLMKFDVHSGGFSCQECLLSKGDSQHSFENKIFFEELKSSAQLREILIMGLETKYADYEKLLDINRGQCDALFNYFCYQFHFQPRFFKTWVILGSV